jgi:hypothetical protein|uniref:Lectin/glucanase superfamily protein n=1 Tax=viral metagenome TaxID=1070528 RepID=A0A6C0M0V3_9ZZZZ
MNLNANTNVNANANGGGAGGGMLPAMNIPTLNEFKSPDVVSGSKSFLDSNSYVAKTAFLILTVIVFVYLLRACVAIMGFLFSPNSSPYLVNGLIDGKVGNLRIPQDPSNPNAVTIIRSKNDAGGIGITWSVWLYIKQNSKIDADNAGKWRHVFNKGSREPITTSGDTKGIMTPNNGPGLYLKDDYSAIRVVMSTFNSKDKSVDVGNIPINKWFNVIIRVENTVLDVFMNGDLAKRLPLESVPFQNYGDVNVAINNGFNGAISSLRYYNSVLGTRAIANIVSEGPKLNAIGASGGAPGIMDYLSMRWFHNQWNAD